jgi:hypothetical protein
MLPLLQNEAVRCLVSLTGYFRAGSIEAIFRLTNEDSVLRQLATKSLASVWNQNSWIGRACYTREDFEVLNAIPDLMQTLFKTIWDSSCGRLDCDCESCCYDISEDNIELYLVPET